MSLTSEANVASGAWNKDSMNIVASQIASFNEFGPVVENALEASSPDVVNAKTLGI